jgi:nitrogenase molybdenum-iron protein beta chain
MSSIIAQPRYTCALAAQQTVLAIPGGIPIVHAGPGCCQKIQQFAASGAGQQGEGRAGGSHVPCTNSYETEIVFGGESKLRKTVDGALKVMKGDLFVILTGCTADIVGDDAVSIAKEYAARGLPLAGAETGGFKGNGFFGHELAVNAIIEQFSGDVKSEPRRGAVNVFSVTPYQNPYWRGDLEELKRLLEAIGLEAHVLYGYESDGVSEWKDIPNAQFNLLVSPWVGLSTVELLEKKYGTPFFHYPVLPVGALETGRFLRETGSFAGVNGDRVEEVIKHEERRYYQYLNCVVDFLTELKNVLPSELFTAADSLYGISLTSFLVNEAGYIPKKVYLIDNPPEDKKDAVLSAALSRSQDLESRIRFETDGGLITEGIKAELGDSKKALFLGSGWEKILALETGNHYALVSLPMSETLVIGKTFTGYRGGLNLIEDIYSGVFRTRPYLSRYSTLQSQNELKEKRYYGNQ